jgi:hypothetical protein
MTDRPPEIEITTILDRLDANGVCALNKVAQRMGETAQALCFSQTQNNMIVTNRCNFVAGVVGSLVTEFSGVVTRDATVMASCQKCLYPAVQASLRGALFATIQDHFKSDYAETLDLS